MQSYIITRSQTCLTHAGTVKFTGLRDTRTQILIPNKTNTPAQSSVGQCADLHKDVKQ